MPDDKYVEKLDSYFRALSNTMEANTQMKDWMTKAIKHYGKFAGLLVDVVDEDPEATACFVYLIFKNIYTLIVSVETSKMELLEDKGLWSFVNSLPFDYDKVRKAMLANRN